MRLKIAAAVALTAFVIACATTEKPSGREQNVVELRAVITGVDLAQRQVALLTPEGSVVLPVADEHYPLDHLRVGDKVLVSYTEAIAWQVKPSDKGTPGVTLRDTVNIASPDDKPGATVERAVTFTTTITAFDIPRGTVTLGGPDGTSQTIKVHKPDDLRRIQVGDLVDITFSEALALSIRPDVAP